MNITNEQWTFNDESLSVAIDEIINYKLENLSIKELTDYARQQLEHEWSEDSSTMEVIEEWEFITGRKIEEL